MNQEKRFLELSEDYELLLEAVPYYLAMQEKLAEIIKGHCQTTDSAFIKVIEVGCGTGITTEYILGVGFKINLVAIDNESTMIIWQSNQKNFVFRPGRLQFVLSDALSYLKFQPDNSFHIIASANTIHNFHRDYREKFLRECWRVLSPGGLFVNSDKYVPAQGRDLVDMEAEQFEQYKMVSLKYGGFNFLRKWAVHEDYDGRPEIIMREKESISQMQEIGFRDAKIVSRIKLHAILTAIRPQ